MLVRDVSTPEARTFLETYHLQGYANSSVKLGLYHGEELTSIMTFGQSRFSKDGWELIRFASKASVRGAASKLLHAFKRQTEAATLISYADRRWSNGNLYNSIGFKQIAITAPSYWYFNGSVIHHRSMHQRHKIVEHPNLTEWEAMQRLGWDRIWDCGTIKYKCVFR